MWICTEICTESYYMNIIIIDTNRRHEYQFPRQDAVHWRSRDCVLSVAYRLSHGTWCCAPPRIFNIYSYECCIYIYTSVQSQSLSLSLLLLLFSCCATPKIQSACVSSPWGDLCTHTIDVPCRRFRRRRRHRCRCCRWTVVVHKGNREPHNIPSSPGGGLSALEVFPGLLLFRVFGTTSDVSRVRMYAILSVFMYRLYIHQMYRYT